mgnify:CR=1 FL=1
MNAQGPSVKNIRNTFKGPFFKNWWSWGEECTVGKQLSGTIADDKKNSPDLLINDYTDFEKLTLCRLYTCNIVK